MDVSLKARSAIVTGGSKGLGFATAKLFAESGADVSIWGRDEAALQHAQAEISQSAIGKITAVRCDVTSAGEIQSAFDETIQALGKVDIVVNNAGQTAAAPFEQITDEAWQADLDLKLFAAIRLTRLAWPQMKERRWGRVINVLSILAKTPAPNSAPTSISRAAGMALTKVLAGEGAPHNILCNALLVGGIESDQIRRRYGQHGAGQDYGAFKAKLGERVPMGRIGEAEEFAAVACFLASDYASYVSGVALNVDGAASPVV
ncbi:MAG: SDR family oxidoreductase [Caulobacterales bacterium]